MKDAREQTATTDEWEPGKKRRAKGERRREAVKKARRVMKRRTGRRRYESGWKVRRRRAATRWHEVGKRPREESRRRAECSSGMRQAGASSLGGAGLRARLSLLEKKDTIRFVRNSGTSSSPSEKRREGAAGEAPVATREMPRGTGTGCGIEWSMPGTAARRPSSDGDEDAPLFRTKRMV